MNFGRNKGRKKNPQEKSAAHTGGEDIRVEDSKRVKTGIPRLDDILKGGLLRAGTYILFGPPGCGKTILTNQMCFRHIEIEKSRCVVMTLLTESHGVMMEHLGAMEFFKPEVVSDNTVLYLSGFQILQREGLKGLLELVRSTLKQQKATMFVMDGVEAVAEVAKNDQEFRLFIHELSAITRLFRCTTILCESSRPRISHPENTVVDGVFEISLNLLGPRQLREFTVHKFRGSDFLQGKHEAEITEKGLQVHPRTEIQFDKPPGEANEKRVRMSFGVPRLDEMLHGGLLSGSACAVIGAPGVGKTLLGLSFLIEGAKKGDCGILFGFYEPPPRLIEKAEAVGLPLRKYVDEGLIEIMWMPPLEHYLDALAEQLLETLRTQQLDQRQKRRLFIDGIEGFRSAAAYPDRMGRFLSAFVNQLRMLDITTLFSDGIGLHPPTMEVPNTELVYVVENVIALRNVELRSRLYRLISIMKMQESDYDRSIREFNITNNGIEVADSFESAEHILTGHARVKDDPKERK